MRPNRRRRLPLRLADVSPLAIAGTLLLAFSVGCTPTEPSEELTAVPDDAPLVPADAEALAAYLKTAVDLYPSAGMVFLAEDRLAAPGAPSTPTAETTAFSTTTLQTAGVDEADLVKFDGETLFVARQPTFNYHPMPLEPVALSDAPEWTEPEPIAATIGVYAASEEPAEAKEIASIELPDAGPIHGLMLLPEDGDAPPLLVVVGASSYQANVRWIADFAGPIGFGEGHVRLWIFDVSDPAEPVEVHRSKVDGNLIAVRRIAGDLVLVTRTTPYLPTPLPTPVPVALPDPLAVKQPVVDPRLAEVDVQDLLPKRWIEWPADDVEPRPLVKPEHCFVPRQLSEAIESRHYYHPTLVTITTLGLREPERHSSVCAAGHADRVFSSVDALYLASTYWHGEASTVVHKFAYTEKGPQFRGSGRAQGTPGGTDPDFGLGEVDDAFGIMTMVWGETPGDGWESTPLLTLLGEAEDGSLALEALSHLPNETEPDRIGKPGEQLYAVRFIGDRLYAVTFRRIDPLYVIDVSDVRDPFIAGELEVPGFSDRLEAITPDLLLGIGKDSIDHEGRDWFQGLKVELFDVSDPSQPVSVDALVIGQRGTDSAARNDHHALTTLDMGDGTTRIAIPIQVAEPLPGDEADDDPTTWYPWAHTGLHLFEVDHETPAIGEAGALIVDEAGDDGQYGGTWNDRSRLQGDAVHYVHDTQVFSASWDAPEDPVGPQ